MITGFMSRHPIISKHDISKWEFQSQGLQLHLCFDHKIIYRIRSNATPGFYFSKFISGLGSICKMS